MSVLFDVIHDSVSKSTLVHLVSFGITIFRNISVRRFLMLSKGTLHAKFIICDGIGKRFTDHKDSLLTLEFYESKPGVRACKVISCIYKEINMTVAFGLSACIKNT